MKNPLFLVLLLISSTSQAGFICNGEDLYTTGIKVSIAQFDNFTGKCQNAVDHSKNGFICFGQFLLTAGVKDSIAEYDHFTGKCQDAVDRSKP